jgi:hypothetical protein
LVDTFYGFVIVKIQNIGGIRMNTLFQFLGRINPMKESDNNSKIEFIIQKIIALLFLYCGIGILLEASSYEHSLSISFILGCPNMINKSYAYSGRTILPNMEINYLV